MARMNRLVLNSLALMFFSLCGGTASADVITTFSAFGTFSDGSTLTGSLQIDTTTGVALAAESLYIGAPGSVFINDIRIQAPNEPFPGDFILQAGFGPPGGGPPLFVMALPVSSLIGYSGGPIVSVTDPSMGEASDIQYSQTNVALLSVGSLRMAQSTTIQGGTGFAPVALNAPEIGQVFGSIGGLGTQDYYSFTWAGGTFSATASVTGPPNGSASYLFSEGVVGTCGSGGSATLNTGDSFTGTITIPNLAAGQYCIGLDANSSNDPNFTLTFNTPVQGVPEPATFTFFLSGLAVIGVVFRRRRA